MRGSMHRRVAGVESRPFMRNVTPAVALFAVTALAACGGDYSGAAPGGGSGGGGGGSAAPRDFDEFVEQRIQPRMAFCRTCHIPGGVGDVDDGRNFMLDTNPQHDLANLQSSWEILGGNSPVSPILLNASGEEVHSGGAPWPQGSAMYQDVALLLDCFEQGTDQCDLSGAGGGGSAPDEEFPLLGSRHGGHAWFDFCEDQPDSAQLPVDPRALVQPGVSDGRAVHFNAFWVDCHADPELVGEQPHPKTCGELRAGWERGERLMYGHGGQGAGTFFAGIDNPEGNFAFDAEDFNGLWRQWGLSERPDNFDLLVAERFGYPMSAGRNPYPLPGEDPNATDGGSGQLPAAMTQIRNADGTWSGRIGLTCHGCHSAQVGTPQDGPDLGLVLGAGNSNADVGVISRDLGVAGAPLMSIFSLFGTARGTNNAAFFNIAALGGTDGLGDLVGVLTSGAAASGATPAWWNVGSRPLKFWDGFFPADSTRVDLAFYTPFGGDSAGFSRQHGQDADTWILALKAPEYPMPIDESLAEQGAILFHSKDLWADGLDNPVRRPEAGNGSCASCHGAHSPRFANDPNYLASPELEGIASYVVPMDIIGTDSARLDAHNEQVAQSLSRTHIGYPETRGTDNDCGMQSRSDLRGDRELGYLAPPLYGVWASAPYFHNGSVPDVHGVLDPDARPAIWRRVSTPAPNELEGRVVMGFDTDLDRAYDQERMGWKFEELGCGPGALPLLQCNPLNPDRPTIVQQLTHLLYGNVLLAWHIGNSVALLQWTPQQVEGRKVYNTTLFSQGNQGHEFTSVLTEQERRAIIEYLKTL